MRRRDREVTGFDEILKVVDACDVCRLGLSDEKVPYIVPLNFGYENVEGQLVLYFHGASEGKKLDLMARNRGCASFEMDTAHQLVEGDAPCDYTYMYQSVIGCGTVEVLEDFSDKLHGLEQIMNHYAGRNGGIPYGSKMRKEVVDRTCVFRLKADALTCKRH